MREILINTNNNNTSTLIKPKSNLASSICIKQLLKSTDLRVSVELCPNRTLDAAHVLSSIPCNFCSVTWRTPSTEESRNVETIPAIVLAKQLRSHGYSVLLHLAGRNLKTHQVVKILETVQDAGIRNIFALQGDPSEIQEDDDEKCDFPYAADLVKFIRRHYGNLFTIGVAGYPEKHPRSKNIEEDLQHLKHKVSCGADFIVAQSCYDYQTISNFSQQCHLLDINIPIIPGIFIISSYRTLMAMSKFCAVPIPKNILDVVEANKDKDVALREFGIFQAAELMKKFFENSDLFAGIHVFSLNNLELLRAVLKRVGVYPEIERPLSAEDNIKTGTHSSKLTKF